MTVPDPLVIVVTRMEGKLDLSAQQFGHMQSSIEEIKASIREDRIGMEQRLKDHVEAVNPHPAQEAWLRGVYTAHDLRLRGLEDASASNKGRDRAVKWLVGTVIALAGVLVGVLTGLPH